MFILTHCSIIGDYCPKTEIGSCDDCPLFQLKEQYRAKSYEMQTQGKGGIRRCINVFKETEASQYP